MHLKLLIPFVMLVLAAIACEGPPAPPAVWRVEADVKDPATAYALIHGQSAEYGVVNTVYETHDYGQHWTPSKVNLDDPTALIRTWSTSARPFQLSVSDDTLFMQSPADPNPGAALWTFPRREFRTIFNGNDTDHIHFRLTPSPAWALSADDTTLYVAMGTEGVLVGSNPKAPTQSQTRSWQLTNQGINEIHPLPLIVSNEFSVVLFILLALLIPPLIPLHAYLLSIAWRYAFPINEQRAAFRLALKVSAGIGVLAVGAVILWLSDVNTDYYEIVFDMTVITVVVSVGAAIRLGRSRAFSDGFVRRQAVISGLLALVVPIGVATNPFGFGWPIIFTLLIGFVVYRQTLTDYLDRMKAKISLWQVDRLTLELLVLFLVMLTPLSILAYLVLESLHSNFLTLVGIVTVPMVTMFVVGHYVRLRGSVIPVKKKSLPEVGDESEADDLSSQLFHEREWWQTLIASTVGWLVGSATIAVVMFVAQVMVWSMLGLFLIP